ncbi:MAG: molybdate ABC transporter permease subunit [Gammaproteobacteria bacterium]
MDWQTLTLSFKLALCTLLALLPVGILAGRALAYGHFHGRTFVMACVALPLVLPPTVLGFYLLEAFGEQAFIGRWFHQLAGYPLAFTFTGLIVASVIFNLPFAILPMQRAFAAIATDLREAAWCCGLSHWQTFLRIELPLAWPGILAALILVFAHTLGEFGVVLMIGGNIPGETRTAAIAIYDYMQVLNQDAAGRLSALLLACAFISILLINLLNLRFVNHDHKRNF